MGCLLLAPSCHVARKLEQYRDRPHRVVVSDSPAEVPADCEPPTLDPECTSPQMILVPNLCVTPRPQLFQLRALEAETSQPHCVLSIFLTHRVRKLNNMVLV